MSSAPSPVFGSDLRSALVAMVRKRVPESEVEDIVQSTLADAIESPHAPKDSESLRRWIFGVAKNKVVDYHRRAGRETFEVPEVPGKPAPHAEEDLLRWAERNLPPGEENKTTLDWMLREGEGEKLEWIAEADKVPAPRVRQRVSRLRRHLKAHWQKEVALLATLGVLITILLLVVRRKDPEPIANEDLARAAQIRKVAFEKCLASEWKPCVDGLDEAKRLDPAGDSRPEVKQARANADKARSMPPTPAPTSENLTPPPSPTLAPVDMKEASPSPVPPPSPSFTSAPPVRKPTKSVGPWPDSSDPSDFSPPPAPKTTKAPPAKSKDDGSSFGGGKKQAVHSKPKPLESSTPAFASDSKLEPQAVGKSATKSAK